jgi:L-ribulose-5-phosphate 3-epimerase
MQWAFMTANYVGRALGYADNTDWMANHRATVEAFHGPKFGERFAAMIDDIRVAGFDAIELWAAHLEPLRATPEMIDTVNQFLRDRGIKLISYTAGCGQPGVSREDAT